MVSAIVFFCPVVIALNAVAPIPTLNWAVLVLELGSLPIYNELASTKISFKSFWALEK